MKAPIQQTCKREQPVQSRNSFEGLDIEEHTFEGCLSPNQRIALGEQRVCNQKCTKVLKLQLEGIDVCLENIASNQRQIPLLQLLMQVRDVTTPALLDSGASHNFINPQTTRDFGQKLENVEPLAVRLADKTQVFSKASCNALVTIGRL